MRATLTVHYKPLHRMTYCRERDGAVSESLFCDGLCLPSGSSLTEADLTRVAECVRGFHVSAHRWAA
jgi:pyridoxal phosphate-dependent aminotransferase EpsN